MLCAAAAAVVLPQDQGPFVTYNEAHYKRPGSRTGQDLLSQGRQRPNTALNI